ncbi:pex7 [Symbiodinium sp. CCMP2456]|nr:pex7 [Symbiodinium sp. CCMP2456]
MTNQAVYDVAWSEANEHVLLTGQADGTLKLFDWTNPQGPIMSLEEHTAEVYGVDWNLNEKHLISSAAWDHSVKVWDAMRGVCLSTFRAHQNLAYAAIWSPARPACLASVGGDAMLHIQDLNAGEMPVQSIQAHQHEILTVDWNKYNEFMVVTGSVDKTIRTFDLRNFGQPLQILHGHQLAVKRVKCHPYNETQIVSCSYDTAVNVFDMTMGQMQTLLSVDRATRFLAFVLPLTGSQALLLYLYPCCIVALRNEGNSRPEEYTRGQAGNSERTKSKSKVKGDHSIQGQATAASTTAGNCTDLDYTPRLEIAVLLSGSFFCKVKRASTGFVQLSRVLARALHSRVTSRQRFVSPVRLKIQGRVLKRYPIISRPNVLRSHEQHSEAFHCHELDRQVNRAAVLPLAVAAVLACVTKFCGLAADLQTVDLPEICSSWVGTAGAQSPGPFVPIEAACEKWKTLKSGPVHSRCRSRVAGSWKPTGEIDIQGPEEEALAQSVWEAFQEQYTGAAERGMYMDTPVGENDIKYRWRRLRDTFGITSEEAVGIMQTDALPLVIDADYVQVWRSNVTAELSMAASLLEMGGTSGTQASASEPLLPSALRTLADRKELVEGQIAEYDGMPWFQRALFDTSAFQAHADWLKQWRQEWAVKIPQPKAQAPSSGPQRSPIPKARENAAEETEAEDVEEADAAAGSPNFKLPAVAAAKAALEKFGTDWKAAGMDSVVEEVVNLMQSDPQNAFVQERGCESLRYLCTDDESRQAVAAKDAIPTILRSMELNENESEVQGYCCGTLVHLAATASTRRSIVQEKGLEAILRAMQMHPSNAFVQFKACAALANLAATSQEQSLLASLGGGEMILKTMRLHVHDLSVLEYCLGALHNLATYHGNQAALRTAGAVRVLRDAVRLHPQNHQVQQVGKKTIRLLKGRNAPWSAPTFGNWMGSTLSGADFSMAKAVGYCRQDAMLLSALRCGPEQLLGTSGLSLKQFLLWIYGLTCCDGWGIACLPKSVTIASVCCDSCFASQKTFKAMVDGADRDKALEIVTRHPGILAAGPDVKDNMLQADLASNAINAARSLGNLFR